MRIPIVVVVASLVSSRLAGAEVDPPAKWKQLANKKLGVRVKHPASAKLGGTGTTVTIAGPELPTVTIAVETTTERTTSKLGGARKDHVEWTIAVPKRLARCTADVADPDQAQVANSICDSIELAPGARDPHVELTIDASGLADTAAFDKAVHGKQRELDRCWKAALAKDGQLPEGGATLERSFENGQLKTSEQTFRNFGRDTKVLAACFFPILKAVAVKTAADAAHVKIDAVFRIY